MSRDLRVRGRWGIISLLVGCLALLVGACERPLPTDGTAAMVPLRITAVTVGTPISTLVVQVTATDIPSPLVFNLTVVNGVASGTIKIPPGPARTIEVTAMDAQGNVTHEGSVTLDVRPGQNPPLQIKLGPRSGHVPITVTFGNFGVVVTPTARTICLTAGATVQLTVTVTDVNGQVIAAPEVGWATTNPGVATVSASGLVTGVASGTATIVATYEGVAGLSVITVTAACGGGGGVVTWGSTTMKFNGSSAFRALLGDNGGNTDDYTLVRNILQHLSGKTSNVRILYTDTCDPRTDANVCAVGGLEFLQPFYDMIGSIGTITYADMSSVQLADYDVVIADFCSLPSQDYDLLKSFVATGGPAMVLADNFCFVGQSSTADLANTVMAGFGITFSANELIEKSRFQIPSSDQVGLLTGVSNLDLWRLTPQVISHDFVPVATWNGNVLYAIHEGPFAATATAMTGAKGMSTSGRLPNWTPTRLNAAPGQIMVAKLVNGKRALIESR